MRRKGATTLGRAPTRTNLGGTTLGPTNRIVPVLLGGTTLGGGVVTGGFPVVLQMSCMRSGALAAARGGGEAGCLGLAAALALARTH